MKVRYGCIRNDLAALSRQTCGMAVNLFEELVRSAVQAANYLTIENVCYRRNKNAKDILKPEDARVSSDIDLIAIAPHRSGPDRVLAINIKGGRGEMKLPGARDSILHRTRAVIAGGPARTGFRELVEPSWRAAFKQAVHGVTRETVFTHVTICKRIAGDRRTWTEDAEFRKLTPHLRLFDLADLLSLIDKRQDKLFFNGTARHLRDLAEALKEAA